MPDFCDDFLMIDWLLVNDHFDPVIIQPLEFFKDFYIVYLPNNGQRIIHVLFIQLLNDLIDNFNPGVVRNGSRKQEFNGLIFIDGIPSGFTLDRYCFVFKNSVVFSNEFQLVFVTLFSQKEMIYKLC